MYSSPDIAVLGMRLGGGAGRTQNWNPPSRSENVIERDPFEDLGTDERMGLKWVIMGRIQQCELDSPV